MNRAQKPEYERISDAHTRSPFVFQPNKSFCASERVHLRFHEEMEIKYIRSGTLSVNLGSQIIVAEAGDLVIINPYEYHSNIVEEGVAVYDMLCIDVSEAYMGGLYADFFLPYREGKYRFSNLLRDPAVKERLQALFSALENEETLLVSLGLFSLFFASLSPYKEQPTPLGSRSFSQRQRDFIYKVFTYIHEHYSENISLSALASECYMTAAHFSRTFKALMGEPPISYINQYRINKATVLLTTTTLSLKELAARVGFADEAYFSRAFKKYKGESPTAFSRAGRDL